MGDFTVFTGYYNAAVRLLLPVLATALIVVCAKMLLCGGKLSRPLAAFVREDGTRLPIFSRENAIGRSTACDVYLPESAVSRRHAVLTRRKEGWCLRDVHSKSGTVHQGEPVKSPVYLEFGDTVFFAGVPLRFDKPRVSDRPPNGPPQKKKGGVVPALFFLTFFQLLAFLSLILHYAHALPPALPLCFGGLLITEWVYFGVRRFQHIGVEILAFFLITIGLCVAGSAVPQSLYKQFLAMLLGLAMFCTLEYILKDIERTMKLRYLIGGLAIGLLALNLILGVSRGGAKNWIDLGFVTIQPSEFVKVAFVFAGCATLEKLATARNTLLFVLFSGACIGALFLMNDFGTAAIFFMGMVIIAYMRSGDWKTIAFFSALAAVGAIAIVLLMPHVAVRFRHYLHAWDFPSDAGFQQTRTMIAIGSGGLFGLGGGNGNLDLVAASDTDLVMGFVSEEWGLLIAIGCAACLVLFALYAVRRSAQSGSAYYAIAACAAAGMFLFQAALNLFGSTDLLPFTGVTFPFISNGGSSMAASFAMLAFIKGVTNEGGKLV